MKGWTEFLKELAPPGIFDDMREPEGKEQQQQRQRLLSRIYDLTKKEEEYATGEIGLWLQHRIIPLAFTDHFTDGDDVYYWPTDDADDKVSARKKNRRSWDLLVDDSGTDSYADSAPPSKRSKKCSSATTPVGSPAAPLRRRTCLDDSMQDCKPHTNAGFVSDLKFIRSAAASPQCPPWNNYACGGDVKNHLVGEFVSVYVPTTPNPTSGFFLMMERSKVVELDMTVDAALKYIVSMGVVAPE